MPYDQDVYAGGTAVITGASSGIGEVFARRLAARGMQLLLVARRAERLQSLAAELENASHQKVAVLAADLSTDEGMTQVEVYIEACTNLELLVNCAGFGALGHFADMDPAKVQAMNAVHVLAPVRLSRAALPGMLARGSGAIINVSSVSAFMPVSGSVTYAATKAYLNVFSQSLAAELKGSGVKVQALCPGFTYTGFHDAPEFTDIHFRASIPRFLWMNADRVVDTSLKALHGGRVIVIPGLLNRGIALAGRLGIISFLSQRIYFHSSIH